MNIKIKLFATLRDNRFKIKDCVVNHNTTPKNIIDMLNIKEEDVAILIVNGMDVCMDDNLKEGDVVSIFPPVGGG